MIHTIDEVKQRNHDAGFFFFEPDTMRFFRSVISTTAFPVPNGALFVTSEQNEHSDGTREQRRYTVRFAHDTGDVFQVGKFQQWPSRKSARRRAAKLAEIWTATTFLGIYRNPGNGGEVPVAVLVEHRNPDGKLNGIIRFIRLGTGWSDPVDGGAVNLIGPISPTTRTEGS